jgi:hypothetical protein
MLTERVMLRHPDYIEWMMHQRNPCKALSEDKRDALALAAMFDKRRFTTSCSTPSCTRLVTRFTVYGNVIESPYWWCPDCNIYQFGAVPGTLYQLSRYLETLKHVRFHCAGRRSAYQEIIKQVAVAKGLGARVGDKQAVAFFAPS